MGIYFAFYLTFHVTRTIFMFFKGLFCFLLKHTFKVLVIYLIEKWRFLIYFLAFHLFYKTVLLSWLDLLFYFFLFFLWLLDWSLLWLFFLGTLTLIVLFDLGNLSILLLRLRLLLLLLRLLRL